MLDSTTWMYLAAAAVAGVLLYMYMGKQSNSDPAKNSVSWTRLRPTEHQDMIYTALAIGGAIALYYFYQQSL